MKCQHKKLEHVEVFEAYNTAMYEDGKLSFNNEPGGLVRTEVHCSDCHKRWAVTKSSPKFIRKFHFKVLHDRSKA